MCTIQGVKAKIFASSNCVSCHTLLRVWLRPNSSNLYKLKLSYLRSSQIGQHPSSLLSRQMEISMFVETTKYMSTLLQSQKFTQCSEWMTFSLPYQEVHCSPNLICHTYEQLELDEESKNTLPLILLKDSSITNSCHLAYLCPVHFSEDNGKFKARPIGGVVYIDDILVTGKTSEENIHNLDQVMHQLEQAGVTLKQLILNIRHRVTYSPPYLHQVMNSC